MKKGTENGTVKWITSVKFRRKTTAVLAMILLISGRLSGAIGKDDVPDGSAVWDMQNQLMELWGEPYEFRPIRQDEGGGQVYETMTFTYEPAVTRAVPSLYAGSSLILSGAAMLFPHVTALEERPVLAASETTYLCYNHLYDTSPIFIDLRSAETTRAPTEDDFHSLAS